MNIQVESCLNCPFNSKAEGEYCIHPKNDDIIVTKYDYFESLTNGKIPKNCFLKSESITIEAKP